MTDINIEDKGLIKHNNLFTKKHFVILFAVIAMFSWGCAFPFIKIGMREYAIKNSDTAGKMLFAGIRFFLAGVITLIIYYVKNAETIKEKNKDNTLFKNILWLILYGFINTGFHYFCFYMGISNCSGSKASIIDSLGTFWLIFLAAVFFRERVTIYRLLGCVLGFSGIIVANLNTDSDILGSISFGGEGFLIISTLCAAFGGVIARIITTNKKIDVIKATGYGLTIGGGFLLAGGIFAGGKITTITFKGILVMLCLIAISVVGFVLYNQLLCYNPVGQIAIFNALIPVFGTLTSCVLTGEKFYVKYIIAILFVASGIWFANKNMK